MRKLVLILLLTVFAGIILAETPEIVNPPRPTRKFKWLLVIEHPETFTRYIYTDNFKIVNKNYRYGGDWEENWSWCEAVSVEDYEGCFLNIPTNVNNCPGMGGDVAFFKFAHLKYINNSGPFYNDGLGRFLIAKAPKPLKMDPLAKKREKEFKNLSKDKANRSFARSFGKQDLLPCQYLRPQKAKVIFR